MAIDGGTQQEMNVLPESHLAPLYLKVVTNSWEFAQTDLVF